MEMMSLRKLLVPMVFVCVALAVMPFVLGSTTLATELVVFALGALSATFLAGRVGLLSFGQGLFFGIGAYGTGMLSKLAELGSGVSISLSIALAVVVALGIGYLIVHRRGVYFVMLTLAFAQMGFFLMVAMSPFTGGENGLLDIPRTPLFAGLVTLSGPGQIYAFIAVIFVLALLVVLRVVRSPAGSVLAGIRENESRISALGYNPRLFKTFAFAFAGAIAALAGAMHTIFLGFVPPNVIEPEMSQTLLVMALIGGTGSPFGALVGSAFYVILGHFLSAFWPRWMIIVAVLLIVVVLFLRGGLIQAGQDLAKWISARRQRHDSRP